MKNKGFTLIEILVTVSLMALLVGVSAFSFYKSASQQNLKKTVAGIRTGLKKAKDEAYFGKKYGADCTGFGGKQVIITNAKISIKDICDDATNEVEKDYTEFIGGVNITVKDEDDIIIDDLTTNPLIFPSGASAEYPSGSIIVYMTNNPTNMELINISEAISAE